MHWGLPGPSSTILRALCCIAGLMLLTLLLLLAVFLDALWCFCFCCGLTHLGVTVFPLAALETAEAVHWHLLLRLLLLLPLLLLLRLHHWAGPHSLQSLAWDAWLRGHSGSNSSACDGSFKAAAAFGVPGECFSALTHVKGNML